MKCFCNMHFERERKFQNKAHRTYDIINTQPQYTKLFGLFDPKSQPLYALAGHHPFCFDCTLINPPFHLFAIVRNPTRATAARSATQTPPRYGSTCRRSMGTRPTPTRGTAAGQMTSPSIRREECTPFFFMVGATLDFYLKSLTVLLQKNIDSNMRTLLSPPEE